ncbi:MAG TPA: hypothetical protein VLU41_09865 [Ideonella sp.]|nr:hypothetical protein [Ideonella sp.]
MAAPDAVAQRQAAERAAARRYAERASQEQAHREAVRLRNAQRDEKKPPSAPLPVPGASR